MTETRNAKRGLHCVETTHLPASMVKRYLSVLAHVPAAFTDVTRCVTASNREQLLFHMLHLIGNLKKIHSELDSL